MYLFKVVHSFYEGFSNGGCWNRHHVAVFETRDIAKKYIANHRPNHGKMSVEQIEFMPDNTIQEQGCFGVFHRRYDEVDLDVYEDIREIAALFGSKQLALEFMQMLSEDGDCDDTFEIRQIHIVTADEFDLKNNYGYLEYKDEIMNIIGLCNCGHATRYKSGRYADEFIQVEDVYDENHKKIGIREFRIEKCPICGKDVVLKDKTYMFEDADVVVRAYLAKKGYNLKNYVYDSAPNVRKEVAEQGYGSKILVHDENPMVQREVIQLCEGIIGGWKKTKWPVDVKACLDILKDSKHKRVSNKANRLLEQLNK